MKKIKDVLGTVLALAFVACGSPRSELDKIIQKKNFIPFDLPLDSTRVGTILRGNSKEIYTVARPEKCFPDLNESEALRWVQQTDLPQEYRKVEVSFDASLNNLVTSGNAVLNFKTDAKWVKSVAVEFSGATVEFLDESNFMSYFDTSMPSTCKTLLSRYPFIGQGLRVQSMLFVFKDEAGANIDLTAKMSEIVDISAGVHWSLENNYTLKIDTPKYIGYRMARLDLSGKELNIQYATSADENGRWVFRTIQALTTIVGKSAAIPAEPLK